MEQKNNLGEIPWDVDLARRVCLSPEHTSLHDDNTNYQKTVFILNTRLEKSVLSGIDLQKDDWLFDITSGRSIFNLDVNYYLDKREKRIDPEDDVYSSIMSQAELMTSYVYALAKKLMRVPVEGLETMEGEATSTDFLFAARLFRLASHYATLSTTIREHIGMEEMMGVLHQTYAMRDEGLDDWYKFPSLEIFGVPPVSETMSGDEEKATIQYVGLQ